MSASENTAYLEILGPQIHPNSGPTPNLHPKRKLKENRFQTTITGTAIGLISYETEARVLLLLILWTRTSPYIVLT